MRRFANLADAGEQLAIAVGAFARKEGLDRREVVVLAAMPNGVPVAIPVARALGASLSAMPVERTPGGPVIGVLPDLSGRTVITVDDGVETGAVARAAGAAVADHRPAASVLAVPVCSHEVLAGLRACFDEVIAVERPFGRRALAWHFADFDTIDDATALALLADS